MLHTPLQRVAGLWSLCAAALLLALAASQALQFSTTVNTWWFDLIAGLPGGKPTERSQVAVVTLAGADWHDADYAWDQLIERLAPAAKIALIGCPRSCAFVSTHPTLSRLPLGSPEAAPPPVKPLGHPQIVSGQARWWRIPPGKALEAELLATANADKATGISGRRFHIAFRKEVHIPVLRANSVTAGDIPEALLSDRVVLIGMATDPGQSGFETPLHATSDSGMPLVELFAYALDTLQQGHVEQPLPLLPAALALGLIILVVALLHTLMNTSLALIAGLLISAVLVAATWLFRLQFATWLPLFELLLGQWMSAGLCALVLLRRDEKALGALMLEVSSRVRERLIPASALSSQDSWNLAMRFSREVFDVKRQILLECRPDEYHVREIVADGYSLENIIERRRDYRRAPYTQALEAGGVVQIQRRFMDLGADEVQYMAPLQFAGQLLGFWAFSVTSRQAENELDWSRIAEETRIQISELLFHQREWQEHSGQITPLLAAAEGQRELTRGLINGINLLERRLTQMEQASGQLQTGYLLYDMFGNLLHTNPPMEALARDSGLRIYGSSAFEFLSQLFGGDEQSARDTLNQVLLDNQTAARPVSPDQASERALYLYAHPVLRDEAAPTDQNPFQLTGILLELVDFSQIWRLLERRRSFINGLAHSLEHRIQQITPPMADGQWAQLKREARLLSAEADQLRSTQETALVPLDLQVLLEHVMPHLNQMLEDKQMQLNAPPLLPGCFIRSDPAQLEDLLVQLLQLLLHDAFDQSFLQLSLWSELDEARLVMRLRCPSVGLPDDNLQQLLHHGSPQDDSHWDALVPLVATLKHLNAQLRGSASVGDEVCLDLYLPLVLLDQAEADGA